MQRHSDGVSFRERDAGPKIDNDMSDGGVHSFTHSFLHSFNNYIV